MIQVRTVSQKRKIENFVECRKRPFTTATVGKETGVPNSTILREIKKLQKQGKVKQIGKENGFRVFVIVKNKTKQMKGWDFRINNITLKKIYDSLENDCESTAIKAGFSVRTVQRYMHVLAEEGMVENFQKIKKFRKVTGNWSKYCDQLEKPSEIKPKKGFKLLGWEINDN